MPECSPPDPFEGLVNYLPPHPICSREAAGKIIEKLARDLGIDGYLFPNVTREDGRIIDEIVGRDLEYQGGSTSSISTRGLVEDIPRGSPWVFLAKYPDDSAEYDVFAGRLQFFKHMVSQLVARVN